MTAASVTAASAVTMALMAQSDYSEKWPVTPTGGASLSSLTRSVRPDGGDVWRRCGR
jgi:hypothetical protein